MVIRSLFLFIVVLLFISSANAQVGESNAHPWTLEYMTRGVAGGEDAVIEELGQIELKRTEKGAEVKYVKSDKIDVMELFESAAKPEFLSSKKYYEPIKGPFGKCNSISLLLKDAEGKVIHEVMYTNEAGDHVPVAVKELGARISRVINTNFPRTYNGIYRIE